MLKKIAFSLFISLLTAGLSQAQGSQRNVGEWMAHYYEQPSPGAFSQWIRDVSSSGALVKQSARFSVMIFATEVVKKNPEMTLQWCKEFSTLPPTHRVVFAWSIRNANAPDQDDCIDNHIGLTDEEKAMVLGSERMDPLSKPPKTPGDLDMLWAHFFATGSDVPVNRIIDVLGEPQPDPRSLVSVAVILRKKSAKWSLTSNIRQHQRVLEIAKRRQSLESGQLRKELNEVIESASSGLNG